MICFRLFMISSQPIHIVNVLWGKETRDLYFQHILPTQLGPGNLPFFASQNGCYHCFTTAEDRKEIVRYEAFQKLERLLPVHFSEIELGREKNKYRLMTDCHRKAVSEAAKVNAPLVFLAPDLLFSEGSMRYLIGAIQRGKRVLLTPTIRSQKEGFIRELEKKPRFEPVSSRELAGLSLHTIHPFALQQFWGKTEISSWPSHLYWKIDESNLLIRAFHLHPLLIWPEKPAPLRSTIDDDFYSHACPDKKNWEIIQDSDQLFVVDLTESDFQLKKWMKPTLANLGYWAYQYASSAHKSFVKLPIWVHSEEAKPEWKRIQDGSDAVISAILSRAVFTSFFKDPRWCFRVLLNLGKKMIRGMIK